MTTQTELPGESADQILEELAQHGINPGEVMEQQLRKEVNLESRGEAATYSDIPTEGLDGQQVSGLIDNFPGAMVSTVTDPGHIRVYNRFTGDPSIVNVNMLPAQLKKRITDRTDSNFGKLAFTTRDPGFRPAQGSMKCWLHPESEFRTLADEDMMPTCLKSNIPNEFQVRLHVRRKHSQEFAAIQERQQRMERDEDRSERKALLAAINVILQGQHATDDAVVEAKEPVDAVAKPKSSDPWVLAIDTGQCPSCEWQTEGSKRVTRKSALGRHRKEVHPND